MVSQVDQTISELRTAVSASNDAELAKRLGINQSTISSWKARGRVPSRFTKMLQAGDKGQSAEAPQFVGELQDRGTALALIRFTLLRQEIARSGRTDQALAIFLDLKPFWSIMNRAIYDIRLKMKNLGVDLATAQALVGQEDLRDPDATAQRVAAELHEDFSDNPWLDGYK